MSTTYNYSVTNFLAQPNPDDVRLRIYEKSGKLKYTIDPNIAYFFTKSNIVIIKIADRADIQLDFPNSIEAAQALSKLNTAKKEITNPGCHPEPPVHGDYTVYSKSNLNMSALITVNDGDLSTVSGIIDDPKPLSFVRVFVNGVEVNVGNTIKDDCFFSADGVTKKVTGSEKKGDKLYWVGSVAGYNLDTIDMIDFDYLIIIEDV